jgi:hypothetical protein
MTLSVLVVDADVEVLGDLASRLRALGLEVSIADSEVLAVERARGRRPDAFVIEQQLGKSSGLFDLLDGDRHLADVPRVLIADGADGQTAIERRDAAALARHLYSALPRAQTAGAGEGDFRGDLRQVNVFDLLQLLSMNRRSGTLSITTPRGAGEVRLQDGEVFDAVYRRHEGEKALYRLLGENDGSFAFAGGSATTLRRIEMPTSALLMEGARHADEVRVRRAELRVENAALIHDHDHELPSDATRLAKEIVGALAVPRTLDELLDELGSADLELLETTGKLLSAGHLRRVDETSPRPELASPDRLHLLAALVKRLSREGYLGGARLVFAGDPRRLTALGHALGRLAQAEVPASTVPAAPVPHTMCAVNLPEGARLELVALPLVDAFGALWGLSLPGSAAVVQLPGASSLLLEELAQVVGTPLLDARALVGELDETDAHQVAALVRSALDHLAGA